jgi:hypothetical protein
MGCKEKNGRKGGFDPKPLEGAVVLAIGVGHGTPVHTRVSRV